MRVKENIFLNFMSWSVVDCFFNYTRKWNKAVFNR